MVKKQVKQQRNISNRKNFCNKINVKNYLFLTSLEYINKKTQALFSLT